MNVMLPSISADVFTLKVHQRSKVSWPLSCCETFNIKPLCRKCFCLSICLSSICIFNFCLKNLNYPIQSDFLFDLCRLHIPALVTPSSGLSPAGGAGRCGGGWSSRQSGGRNLRDLLNLCSSYCCFLSTSSCCYSCCSSQRLVDAALSRELPADLFHCLANHLVLKLKGWGGLVLLLHLFRAYT